MADSAKCDMSEKVSAHRTRKTASVKEGEEEKKNCMRFMP
ncbi:hypothetical protein QG37_05967 [Candidozyma auris]|uniref:Uncharacterized protein n=1 Tax=Candidozyma auris TaxID=498019 RepID=A0A0L0NU74_CANAR|nr:hypothetical protein QG37_05967 [[Candida] auris]